MRKSLGRAAEHLGEPPDPLLVWRVDQAGVAEGIRQAVRADIHFRHLLRRPQVAPPCCKRQHNDSCEACCCGQCCCQGFPRCSGPDCSVTLLLPDLEGQGALYSRNGTPVRLIEVALQRSPAADVQCHAMRAAAQHLGVPQFHRDDIEAFALQELHQRRLSAIDHH